MSLDPPPVYSSTSSDSHSPNSASIHHGIHCDGCKTDPIVGIRYKCQTCPDFDLCAKCCDLSPPETHPASHHFYRLESVLPPVLHEGITCDGCHQSPLRGNRYHCKSCADFDLCQYCMSHPPDGHPSHHRYICMASHSMNTVHFGQRCDGCGLWPIRGPRYRCQNSTCRPEGPGYDLCSDCMEQGTKHPSTHLMLRILGEPLRH